METKKQKKEKRFEFVFRGEPATLTYLNMKREHKDASEFINEAVNFYYDYCFYQKGFLVRLIENNFYLCKHILRQLGGKNAKMPSL